MEEWRRRLSSLIFSSSLFFSSSLSFSLRLPTRLCTILIPITIDIGICIRIRGIWD